MKKKKISVIKCRDEIRFRGKDIAKALGYEKMCNAILKHVEVEDKPSLEGIRRGPQTIKNEQGTAIVIN